MPATDPEALAEWNRRCPGAPPPAGLWRSPGQSWAFRKVAGRFKWPSRKKAEGHCGDGINCHRPKADFCDCYCLRCGGKSSRKGGGAP